MEEGLRKYYVNESGVSLDGIIIAWNNDEKIWELVTEYETGEIIK